MYTKNNVKYEISFELLNFILNCQFFIQDTKIMQCSLHNKMPCLIQFVKLRINGLFEISLKIFTQNKTRQNNT